MGVHSSWPHSGLTLRIYALIQLGDLAFLLFRFYCTIYLRFYCTIYLRASLASLPPHQSLAPLPAPCARPPPCKQPQRVDVAVRDAHAQEIQPEYMIRTTASPLSVTQWACTHLGRTAG